MEAPDEAEEDVKPAKQEGSQSSKKVSFSSPEKTPDNLRNGTLSPPKARQNPFNSEGIQDDIDFKNEAPNPKPEDVQINGTEKPKSDIMPSLAKYGVKLPYPEPPKRTLNSPKSQEEDDFQKQELQVPVPKPRTLRMNGQAQDHSMSPLKRDDSFNGTGKPRGILKRRSSSSSTDSESVRIALSAEPNKIALPGSPIPEAGQNSYFDEEDGSDNSSDRLKQVRFSEKIHQRPPSPSPEPYCSKEFGEYGILDPGLSVDGLDNGFGDHAGSEDIILDQDPTDGLSKVHEPNATPKDQRDFTNKQPLSFAMDQVTPKEDLDLKNDELQLETNTDLSIEPPSNASSDEEPLYAVVKKTPAASSPSQQQEFDLDDALREPRFHGQRGTTPQNIYLNEKPLEFGKSFSGEGKITFEASYPPKTRKESYNEEQTPEKARNTEMSSSNMGDDPAAATQDDNGPVESVALWKRHLVLENQEPRQPSPDLNKVPKTSINILQESSGVGVKVEDTFSKHYPKIQPSPTPGEYSKDTKYKSVFLQNRYDEDKPIGLTTDLPDVPNVSKPSGTGQLDKSLLHENREQDLPKSAHFKVMSLKERMNEMPREQMSNPSRFQSLKHFWNVEEKNLLGGATVTSPDKILMNVSSTSKPNRTDVKQRGSEIPADEVIFPNTLDNLSEEEQTSQKVASWLAQTPPVYVDGQMEQNEEPLYSGEGIEERVQKSTIPKKPDEDFANALQKLREEALEDPKITERSRTEVQMLPERRPDLVDSKQTTIPVFSTSQNSIKVKAPATDFQMPDGGFYQRVIQISNKPPATETLSVETKNKPFEQNLEDTVVPERSPSKFSVNFEKLDNSIPDKKVQKESRLPIEESEEVIERSEVPKSRDQQDFISSLKRLEIEASQPPLSGVDADHQVEVPEEEIRQNAVSPVKSSYKIGFEQFGAPTVEFQPQYVTSIDPRTEEPKAFEETVEKSTVPIRKENEELSIALRKLELEASEPYSDEEFDAGIHQEVELEKPRSPPVVQANLSEDRSDIHLYSRHDGKSVDQQPPKVSSYRLKSNAFEEPGKLPVAEESIERTFVESQEGAADFHKRLRQLEEQAKIPEEPEDLLVDDAVKVSQVPSREVNISKKVYSSIESMPTSTENISEDGKVKDNDSPRTHDSSHYKELAKYPQSPEPSGSYSGTGNMLYKKPEVGSPEVSNSKPGKPALSETQSDTASSKTDKYEFEAMKAQDESISKVLDWFSRSSEIADNQPLPVGNLQPSKGTSSQILIQRGANEKEPGPSDVNVRGAPPNPESPNTLGKLKSSVIITQSGDRNSDLPNIEHSAPVSLIEEEPVPTGQTNVNAEARSPLQYGKSGSGFGKRLEQEINSLPDNVVFQLAKYHEISEKEPKDTLKQNQIPLPTEPTSDQEIPEMVEAPHSRLSLSSTKSNNDQPSNDDNLAEGTSIENVSPTGIINQNVEAGNCLEFGKSGGGSGKTPSPSQKISKEKKPSLSLSSADSGDEQSDIKNDEPLAEETSIKNNASPPRLINTNVEGVGSGKTPSPSQEIYSDNEKLDIKNDEPLAEETSIENDASPPRLMSPNVEGVRSGKTSSPSQETTSDNEQSHIKSPPSSPSLINPIVEAENCIEFGKSGVGSGNTPSPSQKISKVKKPRLSLSSTDTDDEQSDIKNDKLLTEGTNIEKKDGSPPRPLYTNEEPGSCMEFGKSGGGSGKTPSPTQKISKNKKPRLSLSSTDTDDEQSDIKNYKLLTEGTSREKKDGSPPRLTDTNVEAGSCMEFGKSGGGSGKMPSPSQKISEAKPRLSLSSTDNDDEQTDIKNELLTEGTSMEKNDGSSPGLIDQNIEAENSLEFGECGGGFGKAPSPSKDISKHKKPSLLSSTGTDNEQLDIKNDELLTQANSIENISPPRLVNSNVESGNSLEFGKSGGGSGKTSSPSEKISEDIKPRLSLSSTESMDNVVSDTNVDPMTPVHVMEESVPPSQINLEAENGGDGSDNMTNQAANNIDPDSQIPELNPISNEKKLKDDKESFSLLMDELIPREVEAGTPKTRELDSARGQRSENINVENSASQEAVKPTVTQRRVSDIKQIWEGDRSDLPAAKKTALINSKQTFNSGEKSVTPRSSSVESDDQSSPSLVTFKKVMVEEEEENELSPIDHLKSFWENGKNKEATKAKPPDSSSIRNGNCEADKTSAPTDSRPKFKKRHTFHTFLEKEQTTRTHTNPPGRSISVSESTNLPKDQQKSTTFQNLRSFWNVDIKAKHNTVNPNDRALLDSKKRQFRSNPDLSKESFVAKIKSKLDSQSLEDIREDTPPTNHVQPVKDLYIRKNTLIVLRKFSKDKSDDSSSSSIEVQENASVQDYKMPTLASEGDETLLKSKSSFKVSNTNKDVSEVVKSTQRPEKVGAVSLRLQKLRDEGYDKKSLEGNMSNNSRFDPKNELANRGVKKQNGDKMHQGKPLLVKQIEFDAPKMSEDANKSHSFENGHVQDRAINGLAQVNGEQIHETVDKTVVPPPNYSDFDKGLLKLYNESLEVSPSPYDKVSQEEFMDIQSPQENFSKVLTVSSSKERNPSFQQPVVINLSSKKMNLGTGDTGPPSQPQKKTNHDVAETLPKSTSADLQKEVIFGTPTGKQNGTPDDETEAPVAQQSKITPAEKQNAKEIIERIEMPTIVPRAPFNYFDEGLKKLYEESRDLTATQAISNSLQALPAKQDSVIERASSVPPAPEILGQEIEGTIGKAFAPTQIHKAKSSKLLQKEALSDQEEPFIESMPSNHVTIEESQPKHREHDVVEGTVSEMSPKEKAPSVEEKKDSLQCEESQESPSKTNSSFTDMRESTPMKEKNNSLRKSTLELYLEAPYRREMSKSMDFELGGYVASEVEKDGYQLNSSNPTEDAPVNSFPQNADTLKRLSQSVPAFMQDEISQCPPVLITDGRDTDSASESSFQIGRHKKSPSSLTNLSGSSGMASMSSVSGSVMSIYSGDFGNVDIKGAIEFSVEYVEQLNEFLIYIYQCKDLAAAEVKKQRSDPYVKAYLLPEKAKMGKRKTAVKKKTLNPVYNEILRYKIAKPSLLAQTLNLSVWHHDALGRNSFLGEVNVNLGTWDWSNSHLRRWYQLEPRTPAAGIGLENRGEMKLSLKYVPVSASGSGTKPNTTGEVYIWIKDCLQLPMLRENKINSFVKCTVLPDTSRKSRQKTRTVDKTPNPIFNHTMVYDGFKEEDLREACVELTVWDHNRLSNHFLGGLRIGLGTGKSYGTAVDWMDSTHEETTMWEKMMSSPNTWVEGMLPLRMFKMAKLTK